MSTEGPWTLTRGGRLKDKHAGRENQHISKVRSWGSKAGDRAGRPSNHVKDFGLSS